MEEIAKMFFEEAEELMGHSSPTITAKIYAHTKTETIATEVAKAFA